MMIYFEPGSKITLDFTGESETNGQLQGQVIQGIRISDENSENLKAFVVAIAPAFMGPAPIGQRGMLIIVPLDRFSGKNWIEGRASVPIDDSLNLAKIDAVDLRHLWSLGSLRIIVTEQI